MLDRDKTGRADALSALCKADFAPNAYALHCIWYIILAVLVFLVLQLVHIDIVDNDIAMPGLLGSLGILLAAEVLGFVVDHRKTWLKYVLLFLTVFAVTVAGTFLTYHTILASVLPLLIAAQYSQRRVIYFSFVLSLISVILIVIFGYEYGLCDANMVIETVSKASKYGGILSSEIPSVEERLPTLLLFFAAPRCLIIAAFVPMIRAIAVNRKKSIIREVEIKYLGEHDRMTGFYNREKYTSMSKYIYSRLSRVAVVYFDVNNLKEVNDNYGHDRGDELIMRTAGCIRGSLKEDMDAYRLGGDEFTVVIPNGSENDARVLIEEWKSLLRELNSIHDDIPLLIACGCAAGEGKDFAEVMRLADRDMYENKMKSKSRKTS